MAMLYRAMSAARQILQPRGLPVPVRDELQALNDLYMAGNRVFTMAEAAAQGGHAGSHQDSNRATPRPTTAPSPPQAGPSSAAPPNAEPGSHAKNVDSHAKNVNSRSATGIPSPSPSSPASPHKALQHKRKRIEVGAEVAIEPDTHSTRCRKRAKVDAPPRTEVIPPARKSTGFQRVWRLFLQSTDTTNPDHNPFVAQVSPLISEGDALSTPAHDPIMDDRRFWKWENRTAEDAVTYWRRNFLPLLYAEPCNSGDWN